MYEAPGIFHALFRLVSPFIDHHTKAKIKFVYGQDAIKEFQEQIPDNVRPQLQSAVDLVFGRAAQGVCRCTRPLRPCKTQTHILHWVLAARLGSQHACQLTVMWPAGAAARARRAWVERCPCGSSY